MSKYTNLFTSELVTVLFLMDSLIYENFDFYSEIGKRIINKCVAILSSKSLNHNL